MELSRIQGLPMRGEAATQATMLTAVTLDALVPQGHHQRLFANHPNCPSETGPPGPSSWGAGQKNELVDAATESSHLT